MNPSYIDTKFHLFTDYHERTPKTISENDLNSHKRTGFRPDLDTVFIIHGFLQNGRVEWMVHMAMELLRKVRNYVCNLSERKTFNDICPLQSW